MPSIAIPVSLRGQLLSGARQTLTNILFSANEPGFTFEPWDISTLFQDRAGTTPVTAAGQSVGLRLDKSQGLALGPERVTNGGFSDGSTGWLLGAGWSVSGGVASFSNPTGTTLSRADLPSIPAGRLCKLEFDLVHTSGGVIVGLNIGGGIDIFGTFTSSGRKTAYVLTTAARTGVSITGIGGSVFTIDNISVKELPGNHQVAVSDAKRGVYGWMPKTGRRNLLNATDTLSTQSVTVTAVAHTLAFTGTGTVTLSGVSTAGPLIGTGAGNRVTLTFTPTAGSLTLTISGSVTLAQLEIGSSATAYQRVTSQYDITEAGVPTCYYVQADGVDDAYVTPTITPNTDKVQVFAGVRKLSDAARGIFAEFSASIALNNGGFALTAPDAASATLAFESKGTVLSSAVASGLTAPVTSVFSAIGDIAADTATLRRNGVQVATSVTDQGTGNFLAYPAYIYSRGGTSLPFNGLDFGHAVRFGPNLDAATIARVESLIARNTPEVTL